MKPFGERRALAERYQELLAGEGIEWGLVGPREGERLWERHLLNSLPVTTLIPPGSTLLDVGSGAGLPGIPIAIERPDLRVTLVEPLARRVAFLELAVAELGLADQVTIFRGRASAVPGQWPVVTARAVAPLARLTEWCWPLVAPGGSLLALKGANAEQELTEARPVLEAVPGLSYALHHITLYDVTSWVIAIQKEGGA